MALCSYKHGIANFIQIGLITLYWITLCGKCLNYQTAKMSTLALLWGYLVPLIVTLLAPIFQLVIIYWWFAGVFSKLVKMTGECGLFEGNCWKKMETWRPICPGDSDGGERVRMLGQVHKNSARGCEAWERTKTLATSRRCASVPSDTTDSFGSLGKGRELPSPALKPQRRKTEAPSLLYFTLSPFHGAEAQLTPVELNLLNCTGGKRGLRALGDFKSRLQGGQLRGETATLNLRVCLLGTGDVCLEWETHTQHTHWKCWTIGIADGSLIYAMWKALLISNCNIMEYILSQNLFPFLSSSMCFKDETQIKW